MWPCRYRYILYICACVYIYVCVFVFVVGLWWCGGGWMDAFGLGGWMGGRLWVFVAVAVAVWVGGRMRLDWADKWMDIPPPSHKKPPKSRRILPCNPPPPPLPIPTSPKSSHTHDAPNTPQQKTKPTTTTTTPPPTTGQPRPVVAGRKGLGPRRRASARGANRAAGPRG
jgi:hypothetical protein